MSNRFLAFTDRSGFDDVSEPELPWQVVRIGVPRRVYLRWSIRSEPVLTSARPSVVTAEFTREWLPVLGGQSEDREVRVVGHALGSTTIHARDQYGQDVKLAVTSLSTQAKYVNFYFVTDGTGKKTRRTSADAEQLLEAASDIFMSQAGLTLIPYNFFQVAVPLTGLALPLATENELREIWSTLGAVAAAHDSAAGHLNVFLVAVWGARDLDWGPNLPLFRNNVVGTAYKNLVIVEDRVSRGRDGLLLAHEIGHCLGLSHHALEEALMYRFIEGGRMLHRPEVDTIREKL